MSSISHGSAGVKRHHDSHNSQKPKRRKTNESNESGQDDMKDSDRESTVENQEEDVSIRDRPTKFHNARNHKAQDRKKNRSSRIHSLKKILARGTLPRTIHQEKERELAVLINDQEEERLKKERKKNLSRYHYVRFVERQKAEKRLRQLRKEQKLGSTGLEEQIHEMEVNVSYAVYSPLGEKYVSLFATSHQRDQGKDNLKESQPGLSDANLQVTGKKPQVWYEIEKAMMQDKSRLTAIRDGKIKSPMSKEATTRPKQDSVKQKERSESSHRPPTKLEDVEEGSHESDEDMSDGGFFER